MRALHHGVIRPQRDLCCKIFALWLNNFHFVCVPVHNHCVLFSRGQYGPQMLKYLTGMVLHIRHHNHPSTDTAKVPSSIILLPILHRATGSCFTAAGAGTPGQVTSL